MDVLVMRMQRLSWILGAGAAALFMATFWVAQERDARTAVAVGAFALLVAWQAWRMRALSRKLRDGSDVLRGSP